MAVAQTLDILTLRARYTAPRRWTEKVFMVRMGGTVNTRYHLVSDTRESGEYGEIFESLCGSESGDWRAIQVGDLPFLGYMCGRCARIGERRGKLAALAAAQE